jgi:hypothetical protein
VLSRIKTALTKLLPAREAKSVFLHGLFGEIYKIQEEI